VSDLSSHTYLVDYEVNFISGCKHDWFSSICLARGALKSYAETNCTVNFCVYLPIQCTIFNLTAVTMSLDKPTTQML